MIPGLLVVLLATGGAEQLPQAGIVNFAIGQKIDALWSGAAFFSPSLAKLVTIALVCVFWLGLRRGILKMEPRMVWVCGGLLALIVALPTTVLGIWGLQFRYQAVLISLAAASVRLAPTAISLPASPTARGCCPPAMKRPIRCSPFMRPRSR